MVKVSSVTHQTLFHGQHGQYIQRLPGHGVTERVKEHLSASALVMGVVMGILNRERVSEKTPLRLFPMKSRNRF